jgi:hypothetical protein
MKCVGVVAVRNSRNAMDIPKTKYTINVYTFNKRGIKKKYPIHSSVVEGTEQEKDSHIESIKKMFSEPIMIQTKVQEPLFT